MRAIWWGGPKAQSSVLPERSPMLINFNGKHKKKD